MERKDDREPPDEQDRSAEIIRRHLSGDRKAFGELVALHEFKVRYECRVTLRGRADVDDAVQEVWVHVLKSLPKFRGDCAFSTWVHAIARTTSLMALRNRWRNMGEPQEVVPDNVLSADDDSPQRVTEDSPLMDPSPQQDERFDNARTLARLRAALRTLPLQQRAAVVLHAVEGGYAGGKSGSSTARRHVQEARRKLRGVI